MFFEEEPGSSTSIFYIGFVRVKYSTGFVRFKYGFCADETHLFHSFSAKTRLCQEIEEKPKTNLQICGF